MKFENLNLPKFQPLSARQTDYIRGGETTGEGWEQNGVPSTDVKTGITTVPIVMWCADSFEDGVWCYTDRRESVRQVPPR